MVFAGAAVIGMLYVLAQAAWEGRLAALFRNSQVIAVSLAHAGEIGLEQAAETGKASPPRPGRCPTRCRSWRRR